MGGMMGRMHALAKGYRPGQPEWKRHSWNEEVEGAAEKFLPASDQIVIGKFNDLLKYLHTLPRDRDPTSPLCNSTSAESGGAVPAHRHTGHIIPLRNISSEFLHRADQPLYQPLG